MPKTQPNFHSDSSMVLLAADGVLLSDSPDANSDNRTRTFSGVANSGKPFLRFGEPAVIDLSDLSYKTPVPALDGHDRNKRVGIARFAVGERGLTVSGTLLSNDYGRAIAADADEGFPWQLSIHAQPGSVERLEAGQDAVVNGEIFTGPLRIMRRCSIREVSFTPTAVDDNTSAAVLSADNPSLNPKKTENTDMTIEEALAKIKALETENDELKKANKALQDQNKKAKTEAKLSAAGFVKSESGYDGLSSATVEVLLSLEDAQCDAMIADLKAKATPTKPNVPDALLSETTPAAGDSGAQLSDDNPLLADAASRQGA